METLRLYINGEWSATEFAAYFKEIQNLYESLKFSTLAVDIAQSDQGIVFFSSPIQVSAIQFGSPGFTDLVGIGAIVQELRAFLEFLIIHFREGPDRKLSRQEKEIEILRLKLQLVEKLELIRSGSTANGGLKVLDTLASMRKIPEFEVLSKVFVIEGLSGSIITS